MDRGLVRPVLDRSFPLARAGDALRRLESGEVLGKVTVEVAPATSPAPGAADGADVPAASRQAPSP